MNTILYFISKNKTSLLLCLAGILFLIAPMSTKEEKPTYVYLVGIVFLVVGVYFLVKNNRIK